MHPPYPALPTAPLYTPHVPWRWYGQQAEGDEGLEQQNGAVHLGGRRLLQVRAPVAVGRAIQLEERRLLPGRGVVAVGGAVEVSSRRLLPERALVVQVNHESCGGAREA